MKLLHIVGARPQFIKASPGSRAIEKHNLKYPDCTIHELLIDTGQHYDYGMSRIFFEELNLRMPDYHLGVGSGTHGRQTGEMLKKVEEVLMEERPDVVMVYGDTNSTLASAKLHIPIAHVEAGLRSFNKALPEEINRILTDHASSILFCPTETAIRNLKNEGFNNIINEGKLIDDSFDFSLPSSHLSPVVINVGDVMYDCALFYSGLAEERHGVFAKLGLKKKEYALCTIHRAENTDRPENLRAIFEALDEIAKNGMRVVLLLHPRTRKVLEEMGLTYPNSQFTIFDPVSYLDMIALEKNGSVILTDSGGVQKEAYFFKVPCITLRDETEWIETVASGWNMVVGTDIEKILNGFNKISDQEFNSKDQNPIFGDGRAAERIGEVLLAGRILKG